MKNKTRLPEGNIIIGRNSIKELLRLDPSRILKLYSTEKDAVKKLFSPKDQELLNRNKVPFEVMNREELTRIARSDSHQSLLAVTKRKHEMGVKEFLKGLNKEESVVLMLDDVQDPHNFGAILRAAECFAVDLVIYSKNKGSGITPSVSKASVGASELVDVISVSNLADTISKFKEAGFWAILADADAEATSIKTFEFPKRSLLIMGSEGVGAQALIKRESDFKVFIELFGRISSLNVSQASAIMLDSYRRQHSLFN